MILHFEDIRISWVQIPPRAFKGENNMESEEIRKYKQVILIRTDLDMGCGKKCVQVAHASLMGFCEGDLSVIHNWRVNGMRKIVLKVSGIPQLNTIVSKTNREGIRSATVVDAGLTQLEPDTVTCVGFQPLAEDDPKCIKLNEITKDLKLL